MTHHADPAWLLVDLVKFAGAFFEKINFNLCFNYGVFRAAVVCVAKKNEFNAQSGCERVDQGFHNWF